MGLALISNLMLVMKFNLTQIGILVGIGAILLICWSRVSEDLVTESAPVSHLGFDETVVKRPYETATFGIG